MRIVQQCSVSGRQHEDCSEPTKSREGKRREDLSEVESQVSSLQAMQDERERVVTRSGLQFRNEVD
jgi:hypothetical protein